MEDVEMNFIDFMKSHFIYLIICILFVILSGFLLLLFPIQNPTQIESQEITFFGISLNNWGIWITIIGAILASIWAVYEYTKATSIRQQEKASEIAKSFSQKLTTKCSIIYGVLENSELYNLLEIKSKNYDNFKIFNTNEIRIIYNDDNFIEKYKRTYTEAELDQIYYRILDTRISFNDFKTLTQHNKHYEENEAKSLFVLDNSYLPFHFSNLISDVLNELEYLCMSLSSQVAGSKYVYQSLHQVFLRTVRLLCVEIALSNRKSYSDKFYTNVIHVYNEWTKLYMKNLENEKKLRNKANNILNPKIKTV